MTRISFETERLIRDECWMAVNLAKKERRQ